MKRAVLFLALLAPLIALADPAATFLDSCSGCHTIGGGDLTGPDLTAATARWPRDDVRAAIERMQDYSAPMTAQQIDEITDLLKDPAVRDRLAAEVKRRAKPPANPASRQKGRRLFFGEETFANGGVACFACHAAEGRGGNLAADLTRAHTRLGETPLLSATQKPAFPMMKAAYAAHPVTSQEALDLAAFLEQTATAKNDPAPERTRGIHGVAAGVAIVLLGAVVIVFRPRR